jgi:hypothetical protein
MGAWRRLRVGSSRRESRGSHPPIVAIKPIRRKAGFPFRVTDIPRPACLDQIARVRLGEIGLGGAWADTAAGRRLHGCQGAEHYSLGSLIAVRAAGWSRPK